MRCIQHRSRLFCDSLLFPPYSLVFFFFNHPAPTEIYTLSLHDALPILFPLFCGAAELTYGARALLSKLVELIPAPHERPPVEAQRWGSAERVTLRPEDKIGRAHV